MELSSYPKTCLTEFKDFDNIEVSQSGSCGFSGKKKKYNYFPSGDILNCEKNNSSRACPVLLCNINYDNEISHNVYKRNLFLKREVLMDPRETFQTNTYEYVKDKTNFENPDMGNNLYFKNIDDENQLKNIKEKLSKCSRKTYQPLNHYHKRLETNLNLQQIHTMPHPLSNTDSSEDKERYPINKCFNLMKKDYCPDSSKCKNPNLPLVDFQELEYKERYNNKGVLLPIGPVRCDYVPCELPWNNVTLRHYKTSKPYKFNKCNTPLYKQNNHLN